MRELKRAYDYIIGGLLCRVGLHKWWMIERGRKCGRCQKIERYGVRLYFPPTEENECLDK